MRLLLALWLASPFVMGAALLALVLAGCTVTHSVEVKRHPPNEGGVYLRQPADTGERQ